jgi:hypothetical protein
MQLVPVEHDPFAAPAPAPAAPRGVAPSQAGTGLRLVPVDHDPFGAGGPAAGGAPGGLGDVPQDTGSGPLVLNVRPSPRPDVVPGATGAPNGNAGALEGASGPTVEGQPSVWDSAGRGLKQGALLNFGDELSGLAAAGPIPDVLGMPSPLGAAIGGARLLAERVAPGMFGTGGGEAYDATVARERAANEAAQRENPASYFAGEMGGAVAGGLALPIATPFRAAEGAGIAARGGAAAGNLATTGAAYGAASGLGGAEGDFIDRAPGAAMGAGIGAVAGPAIGGALAGAGAAGRYVGRHVAATRKPGVIADEMVLRALTRDNPDPLTTDYALARARAAGQEATLADVAGPNTRALAGTIARTPGPGRAPAREFLNTRQEGTEDLPGQGERIIDRLGSLLGRGGQLRTARDIVARQRTRSAPAYERAHAAEIDYGGEAGKRLLDILERIPPQARSQANAIIGIEGSRGTQQALLPLTPAELAKRAAEARRARPPAYSPPPPPKAAPIVRNEETTGRPLSLKNFIARNGGLELNPDTAAADFHVEMIPGAGMLARRGGKSIDSFWREKLVEHGYLPRDALATDVRKFLFDALDAEIRHGQKTYPIRDQGRSAGRSNEDMELERASREVLKELREAGVIRHNHEADTAALHDAAESWFKGHTKDPLDAYEQAVMQIARETEATAGPAAKSQPVDLGPIWEESPKIPGGFALKAVPNVRQWDYIKRGLDSVIDAHRDSITGKLDTMGRAVDQLRREMLGELDKAVPTFARARQVFAGDAALLDALRDGQGAWRMTPEELASAVKGLNPSEGEMFRLGAANALRERLSGMPDGADKARAAFGNPSIRDKIKMLAPTKEAHGEFVRLLRTERDMFETRAQLGGSPTAERVGDALDVGNGLVEGLQVARDVARHNLPALMLSLARQLAKVKPEMRGEVLNQARLIVLNPDPAAITAFVQRVNAMPMPEGTRQRTVGAVMRALPQAITNQATEERRRQPALSAQGAAR